MFTKFTLDLVHPIYNPKPGWSSDFLFYFEQFEKPIKEKYEIQVYLVNDGSTQGIVEEEVRNLQDRIANFHFLSLERNLGKGAALREGMKLCNSELIIYTDFDFPYLMQNMWHMLEKLSNGSNDIVVGVRDEQYYDQLPLRRMVFSLSLKILNYVFFPKLKVKDTQSGLKGFNQKGKELFLKTKIAAFLFDMEFLVMASKDPTIRIDWIYLHAREGIVFSGMKFKTICIEMVNFLNIWFKRV